MTTSTPVCVLGSANADLVVRTARLPGPGETVAGQALTVVPGGKSANQAVAAARLGAQVSFLGCVGTDSYGDLLLDSLGAAGVECSGVTRSTTATGTAMIAVDDAAENFIIVSPGANAEVTTDVVRGHAAHIAEAGLLGLAFEIPMAAVVEAAQIAAESSTTVVLNPSPFQVPSPELLALVDVLVLNDHEFCQLAGPDSAQASWEQRLATVAGLGPDYVVVTLGADGAIVLDLTCGSFTPVPGVPVAAVDTTGCGDAFTGALLLGLAEGQTVEASAHRACRVGALAATKPGAQSSYPDTAELAQFSATSA